jgi:hypothetical protein
VPGAAYDSFLDAMARCWTGPHELGCFHRGHLNPPGMSTRILGFREGFRAPFDFPGIWLYLGDDESEFGVAPITVHE